MLERVVVVASLLDVADVDCLPQACPRFESFVDELLESEPRMRMRLKPLQFSRGETVLTLVGVVVVAEPE